THTHTQLRHCLAFLLFIIIPYNSFAIDACIEDDSIVIIPIGRTDRQFTNGADWYSTDDDGVNVRIRGTSACLNDLHGVQQWEVYYENNGILIENGKQVVGGEQNGKYCFCKITYPVVSLWVNRDPAVWASPSTCTSNCAYWCVQFAYSGSPMWVSLMESLFR
ncbi:MAG: hypothetical protein IJL05_04675, partial [Alphaproteobacteria bacterium]|nr:hypothetical protein [Alphaproteobacteria bacterium]